MSKSKNGGRREKKKSEENKIRAISPAGRNFGRPLVSGAARADRISFVSRPRHQVFIAPEKLRDSHTIRGYCAELQINGHPAALRSIRDEFDAADLRALPRARMVVPRAAQRALSVSRFALRNFAGKYRDNARVRRGPPNRGAGGPSEYAGGVVDRGA